MDYSTTICDGKSLFCPKFVLPLCITERIWNRLKTSHFIPDRTYWIVLTSQHLSHYFIILNMKFGCINGQ